METLIQCTVLQEVQQPTASASTYCILAELKSLSDRMTHIKEEIQRPQNNVPSTPHQRRSSRRNQAIDHSENVTRQRLNFDASIITSVSSIVTMPSTAAPVTVVASVARNCNVRVTITVSSVPVLSTMWTNLWGQTPGGGSSGTVSVVDQARAVHVNIPVTVNTRSQTTQQTSPAVSSVHRRNSIQLPGVVTTSRYCYAPLVVSNNSGQRQGGNVIDQSSRVIPVSQAEDRQGAANLAREVQQNQLATVQSQVIAPPAPLPTVPVCWQQGVAEGACVNERQPEAANVFAIPTPTSLQSVAVNQQAVQHTLQQYQDNFQPPQQGYCFVFCCHEPTKRKKQSRHYLATRLCFHRPKQKSSDL